MIEPLFSEVIRVQDGVLCQPELHAARMDRTARRFWGGTAGDRLAGRGGAGGLGARGGVAGRAGPRLAIVPIHRDKGSDFAALDIGDTLRSRIVTASCKVEDVDIVVR